MTDELENIPESEKAKIYTGKPGRPKGIEIRGASKETAKGGTVTVGGAAIKGTKILDKSSKTEPPKAEITYGEGDIDIPTKEG
jgi:hypothetical protein